MSEKVHLEGRVQDLEGACIPVTDHGFLFGDSVFETLRALDGRCAFAPAHLARLRRSAASCLLTIPWSDGEILAAAGETLAAAGETDAAVRVVVTRGSGPLAPDPTACHQPRLLVFVRPRPAPSMPDGEAGVALVLARRTTSAPGMHAKTGNYLASVVALAEAREAGAFEAILLNAAGRVTECAGSNLFIVRAGAVLTPPVEEGLLPGIARANALSLCAELGVEAREEPLWPGELPRADEIFITSTLKEILAVRSVDGLPPRQPIPGPITRKLAEAYRARLHRDVGLGRS